MPDSLPPVRSPARFVPISAVAIGSPGSPAAPVSNVNPLPTSDAPFASVQPIAIDQAVVPGRAVLIDCSAAGMIAFEFSDGSQLPLNIPAGVSILPLAIARIASAQTTATFNAWGLA